MRPVYGGLESEHIMIIGYGEVDCYVFNLMTRKLEDIELQSKLLYQLARKVEVDG